jgi:amino acid transporter
LALLVDTSVYVVLSTTYLQNQLGFGDTTYYLICWAIILLFTLVNILGVKIVALSSSLFSLFIIAPFIVLGVLGLMNWQFNPLTPITPPNADLLGNEGALVLGLSIGLWMYSGYESMSTLAGEIEQPQRIIPKALMLVLPFVAFMYLLPTVASIAAFGHWELFSVDSGEGKVSFVDIGRTLGGTALGHALLASAVLGNLALYLDYMASGARPLQALADDGLFPPIISHVSKRFGTPIAAIALVAGVNAVLIAGPFQSLVIIDVMLMVCSYAVIFIAAVHLRRSDPDLHRPFKIPLGTRGLAALMIPPLCLVVFMLYMTLFDRSVSLFGSQGVTLFGQDIGWYGLAGLLALLSGPVLYPLLRHRYGGPAIPCHEAGNP